MSKPAGEQPQVHSSASAGADGRLHAPSAARNVAPILETLAAYVPAAGQVLELASGTGEHAIACAGRFPDLVWQPTDISPDRLTSIDVWRAAAGTGNLLTAQHLDASTADWNAGQFNMVLVVNLFHLMSQNAARNVIRGVARALIPGGRFFVYGPFRTDGAFRSPGDAAFHERLVTSDPRIGYKDLEWMRDTCAGAGLFQIGLVEMPANNLSFVTELTPA